MSLSQQQENKVDNSQDMKTTKVPLADECTVLFKDSGSPHAHTQTQHCVFVYHICVSHM